jgi:hypothetical protein
MDATSNLGPVVAVCPNAAITNNPAPPVALKRKLDIHYRPLAGHVIEQNAALFMQLFYHTKRRRTLQLAAASGGQGRGCPPI